MLISPSYDPLAVHVVQPYAVGDTLYADTTASIAKLPFVPTATRYLANTGGGATIPAWDFVNMANGVSGILGVANGGTGHLADWTANGVLYASAAGVLANSPNLTFDGTRLTVGSSTAGTATAVANIIMVSSATIQKGMILNVTHNRDATLNASACTGLDFNATWQPLTLTVANRTLNNLWGGNSVLTCSCPATATKNAIATEARGYYSIIKASEVTGSTGVANITAAYSFYSDTFTKQAGAITTAYAFYDKGQTAATNNWGFYGLTANHFLAALQIGGTPTVGMGAGTLTVTDLTTATGGISNGSKYIGKVTVVTDTYVVLTTDETVTGEKATAFAITLFPAVTATIGQRIIIKNLGAGAITITADATGTADLIDGVATLVIYQWESAQLVCTAADKWSVI